ncbi:hypothetical protein [Paenibacillus popilliae]|uniref:hypothetical protein n=1 Tax=Paenibacillus popilliae TaxID=78057 RepID=UPI0002E5D7ED|nr:hypothetical protein [Paenibacillus popilliae]
MTRILWYNIEKTMHVCGHNAHTATLLSVVRAMAEHREPCFDIDEPAMLMAGELLAGLVCGCS